MQMQRHILRRRTSLRNQTGPPSCNCPSHYLQDNSQQNCVECDAICKTCTGTVDNCSSCFEPERDPTKYCACSDGYVENDSNTCLSCGPRCITCQNYLNVDYCQTCGVNRSTTPDCLCNLGFVEDINFNCLQCGYKCSTCNDPNDINLCENCSDTNREGDYCLCKDGYVDDGSNPTCLQLYSWVCSQRNRLFIM
ncbi:Insulin-like growth factor binding protein, N-terminal [Pseudocohnilembus persalinus]|uniref:Insulin-like growth factor binding protein, N-terminal n=1 Tax=Pseudocohnilembus persalinus TaxID=266149 RepID=A0A0V0QGQ2_PSEPJ|nr:Insulin-like growth factor binding protein, N-terminal [Pseudocohnilembus persalinus]|eukprot:KRX01473.1 Insulin-like growth factor binding protein, N-terminal [Pseudocohnilembus persalinus]